MIELDNVYFCGACNRQQQPSSGIACIGCGLKTVTWPTRTKRSPPRSRWNIHNGFSPDMTREEVLESDLFRSKNDEFARRNRQESSRKLGSTSQGVHMSTQARFDPDLVEAFAQKLKMYTRTLEDYEVQVMNALQRLGETFDDADYQELCSEFVDARRLIREMVEASDAEIPRIEASCADVRANQSERLGG